MKSIKLSDDWVLDWDESTKEFVFRHTAHGDHPLHQGLAGLIDPSAEWETIWPCEVCGLRITDSIANRIKFLFSNIKINYNGRMDEYTN